MATPTDPPGLLIAGGLLAVVTGLAVVSATPGAAGTTLVIGGLLLLISRIGLTVHARDPG